jgi:anti-anti-sigma factor
VSDSPDPVEAEIGRVADEIGRCAMLDEFDRALTTASDSESVQKLVLMINVLLDCVHSALGRLRGAVLELAAPAIPVWEGVLLVPLQGALDRERAASLTRTVLPEVAARQVRSVIIDLTGTTTFDAASVAGVLQLARALRLLGADAVLVGLRPAIARALVDLHVDITGLRTMSTLQEALQQCVERGSLPGGRAG